MGTFVLIHGAWHGAWCWYKVIPLLQKAGHPVIAPDLPGHGENMREDISKVTFQDYMDCVTGVIDRAAEPVILVGHSMGGIVASQAAEYRPDKIKKLVYISSLIRSDGLPLKANLRLDLQNSPLAEIKQMLYGDCSDEDVLFAKQHLCTQPLLPLRTPVKLTTENFGRVPKVFIGCLRDNALRPERQKQLYTETPCEKVISMDTSHSPFFSRPEELVKHLISL